MAESVATLERDLPRRESLRTHGEAEAFYNPIRLHSTLGYRSPVEWKGSERKQAEPPNQRVTTKPGHSTQAVLTILRNRAYRGQLLLTSEAAGWDRYRGRYSDPTRSRL